MMLSQRDRAYAHIRQKMLLGEIGSGSRLSELSLAKEIGISRTPVREALNQLGTEGLLEHVPHYGTFVRKLQLDDVRELYELREMLEGYGAERAAQRLSRDQLEALANSCEQLHQLCRRLRNEKWNEFPPQEHKNWVLADATFHMTILRASGNRRTIKIVTDLKLLTTIFGREWIAATERRALWHYWTWGDHQRVLRALQRRDGPAARRWMSYHIRLAKENVLRRYRAMSDERTLDYQRPESLQRMLQDMEEASMDETNSY